MTQLSLVVVSSDFDPKLNLFDFCVMLFSLFLLFGQFIFVLSKVGNTTDRRSSIRRNFDQIESIRLSLANSIVCFYNTELLAGRTDDNTNFASANSFVDADKVGVNKIRWVDVMLLN